MTNFPLYKLPPWVATTAADTLWQRRSVRLLRYRSLPEVGGGFSLPILIVPSIINRHYVMDLMPGRSLVRHLLQQGLDVYLVDWGRPRDEDRFLDLDSCIVDLLGGAVRRALRDSGARQLGLLGYCMGGTMAAIYAGLYPRQVSALINLAGPIDFTKGDILFGWTDRRWFDPDLLVDAMGNLPPQLMQGSFSWLAPTASVSKVRSLWKRGGEEEFLRQFIALETWTNDNVPFPGEAYRKYIKDLFQQNLLIKGEYRVRGKAVDLKQVSCPVLVISATRDHIVPTASARPLLGLVGSTDTAAVEVPGGHVGMVVGSGATKYLWPALNDWLLPRSGPLPRWQGPNVGQPAGEKVQKSEGV